MVQVFSVEPSLPDTQLSSLPLCYVEVYNWGLAGGENRCKGGNLHCTTLKHLGRGTFNPSSSHSLHKEIHYLQNFLHKAYESFRFSSKVVLSPYSTPTDRDAPYRQPSFTVCQDTNGAHTEAHAPLYAFVCISGTQPNSPPRGASVYRNPPFPVTSFFRLPKLQINENPEFPKGAPMKTETRLQIIT